MASFSLDKEKALRDLRFDPGPHRYSYKGFVVPNVTSMIDWLLPFAGMPPALLEAARQRGREVHALTELSDRVDRGEETEQTVVSTRWTGYLEAWWKFKRDFDFEPLEIEQRVFHRRHRYAGTLDRVGVIEGHLAVLDIKTGVLYPEFGLQTAAYLAAANDGRVGEKITHRYSIQLTEDGRYIPHEFKDKEDLSVFLSALSVYQWREKNNR